MVASDESLRAPRPRAPKRFGDLSPWARALVVALAAILTIYVLAQTASGIIGGTAPSGPDSSSYATTSSGLAAFESLVIHFSHPVQRVRTPLSDAHTPARSVIIIAHPSSTIVSEVPAIRHLLDAAHTVVLTGVRSVPAIQELLGRSRAPTWSPAGSTRYYASSQTLRSLHIDAVATAGTGSWVSTGTTTSLLRSGSTSLAVATRVGKGRLIMVADTSCLQNQLLGEQDNAAFALYLAGRGHSTVVFDEYVHGYGTAGTTGLSGIPTRWQWGLALAIIAALVWMWSRSRRLGEPESAERSLPPPRRRYVDSMALEISRTRDLTGAAEPLRIAALRRIDGRLGLRGNAGGAIAVLAAAPACDELAPEPGLEPTPGPTPGSTPEPTLGPTPGPTLGPAPGAYRTLGIPEEVLAAVSARVSDESDLLALGRALAWLQRERR